MPAAPDPKRGKMAILIRMDKENPSLKERKIERKLGKVLEDLGFHDKELSVLLTDDEGIAELNARHLGKAGPTNVLAFPMEDKGDSGFQTPLLGDVVVSLDTALRESAETGETLTECLDRLLVHGILHLAGYDHETSASEAARMEKQEQRLQSLMREV